MEDSEHGVSSNLPVFHPSSKVEICSLILLNANTSFSKPSLFLSIVFMQPLDVLLANELHCNTVFTECIVEIQPFTIYRL